MHPKNPNEIKRSDLFTQCQLSYLLDGYLDGKVYGSLQNVVAALRNSPAQPATQDAVSTPPRSQFNALVEKIDLQLGLLEEGDERALGDGLPSLENISQVRSALIEYEAVCINKDQVTAILKQKETNVTEGTAGEIDPDLSSQERILDKYVSNARLAQRAASSGLKVRNREETSASRSESSEIVAQIEKTALPPVTQKALDFAANRWSTSSPTAFLSNLNRALGTCDAMTITDCEKRRQLFLNLYATVDDSLLEKVPKNLSDLLEFLLPPAATSRSPLMHLQLILAAVRGVNPVLPANLTQLLKTRITPTLTFEMLLSRKVSGATAREQLLLTVNELSVNEQKLAVLQFAKVMMGVIQTFIGEYRSIDEEKRRSADEQNRNKILDSKTLSQLNLESQVWQTVYTEPGATPASVLLRPENMPAIDNSDWQLPKTRLNYIAHDHEIVGATGYSPESDNQRIAVYHALLQEDFAAVHIISNKDEDSNFDPLFCNRDQQNWDATSSVPYVESIIKLDPASCTPFPDEIGGVAIERAEYDVTLVVPSRGNRRTVRVLETFIDNSDNDPLWENHCALRQAFLKRAQDACPKKPLLTLSPEEHDVDFDPETAPEGTPLREALILISTATPATQETPEAVIAELNRLSCELADAEVSPILALQMVAADILWQDPQHTLTSAVSALRSSGFSNALKTKKSLARLEQIDAHRQSQLHPRDAKRFMTDFLHKNLDKISARQSKIEAELEEGIEASRKLKQSGGQRQELFGSRKKDNVADVALNISDQIRTRNIPVNYEDLTKDGPLYYIVHNGALYDPVGVIPQQPQDIVKLYEFIFENKLPSLHIHTSFQLHFPYNIFQMEIASTDAEELLTQEHGLGATNKNFIVSRKGISSAGQAKMQLYTDQQDSLITIPRKQLYAPMDTDLKIHHHTVLLVKDGRKHRLNVLVTESVPSPTQEMAFYFQQQREQFRRSDPTQSPIITLCAGLVYRPSLLVAGVDILFTDHKSTAQSVFSALSACTEPRALGSDIESIQLLVDVESMRETRREAMRETNLEVTQVQHNYNAPAQIQEAQDELTNDDGSLL